MITVVGPSGCGKSSLVRAGLLPAMAPEPGWWVLAPVVPGEDPVGALARELAAAAVAAGPGLVVEQVRARLEAPAGLADLADELLVAASGRQRRRRLLLVVDQFEEMLTRASPERRGQLARLLAPPLPGRSRWWRRCGRSFWIRCCPTRTWPRLRCGRSRCGR